MASRNTELRKLEPVHLCQLAQILNQSDSWKKLMAIVPREDNEHAYMFNSEHILMIEQAIVQQRRSGAEVFLAEWSTWGKKRPSCQHLLDLLIKAELFRAADYVAVDILKGDPPVRPKFGPAAVVDVSEKVLEELMKQQADNLEVDPVESDTLSMYITENQVEVVASSVKRKEEMRSDLMKFSTNHISSLMKFSKVNKKDQVSNLMKFSATTGNVNPQENLDIEEAHSEDIPVCVHRKELENGKACSTIIEHTESVASMCITNSAVNMSKTSAPKEHLDFPELSQNDIPLVVLEFNEKNSLS